MSRARRDVRVNCGPQRSRCCRAKGPVATAARDMALFERIPAREYARVAHTKRVNVAAPFAGMKAGAAQIESLTIRDLRARVFGDAAIVSMHAESKGTQKGTPISAETRGTDFFVKRDGRLQVFNGQITTMKA